jgi:hypothetical protein
VQLNSTGPWGITYVNPKGRPTPEDAVAGVNALAAFRDSVLIPEGSKFIRFYSRPPAAGMSAFGTLRTSGGNEEGLLMGVKLTQGGHRATSASDPKRTFVGSANRDSLPSPSRNWNPSLPRLAPYTLPTVL